MPTGSRSSFSGVPACHHLLGILRRHDRGEVHGEVGDERRLRCAQGELDRVVVDFLDGLEQVAHVHAREVLVSAARDLVEGMVRVELPHEREHDVVGVEVARGREALRAVPLHSLAQLEGVDEPVVRDREALGEAGDGLGVPVLELDQPIVDRLRGCVERGAGREQHRAEALRAAFRAVDQRLGLDRGAERQHRHRREHGGPDDRTHENPLPRDH